MQPCQKDSRSFFEKLQNEKGLDLRDARGKRHDLAVILVGVRLAVLSNRDGCTLEYSSVFGQSLREVDRSSWGGKKATCFASSTVSDFRKNIG